MRKLFALVVICITYAPLSFTMHGNHHRQSLLAQTTEKLDRRSSRNYKKIDEHNVTKRYHNLMDALSCGDVPTIRKIIEELQLMLRDQIEQERGIRAAL